MLYWLTRTAGSAGRIYYERAHASPGRAVPDADGRRGLRPRQLHPAARDADRTENIVRWTSHPDGGHFAALEQPTVLVDDIRAFFSELAP